MQRKKTVLIDLTNLDNTSCGFGQIALNYAHYFSNIHSDKLHFVFLVPSGHVGKYGNNVSYVEKKKLSRFFPFFYLPKVDLWHSVNQQNKLLRLGSKTKYILTIHDANFLVEKKPQKAARYKRRLQSKIDRANAITSISNYTANYIYNNFDLGEKKIQVILNGVETITGRETEKPIFVKTDRPFFFAIGQMRKKKNFHKLVEIMSAFPEYDLYICGDTKYQYADEIMEYILKNNLTNVFIPGSIAENEKNWLYANCNAYLFPSEGEGFGLPAIEAMQFGKAVFISNYTSLPEVCGGHAFIWKDLESNHMIEIIKSNLDDFYNNQEAIEKEKQYAATFEYEKHIESYLKLYEKLLFN